MLHIKIWLWLAKRFQRRRSLKMVDDGRTTTTDGRRVTAYPISSPEGSGELIICVVEKCAECQLGVFEMGIKLCPIYQTNRNMYNFSNFVLLIVPSRYFCGGSFCFMSWCLKYFCAVGALCMFAYF